MHIDDILDVFAVHGVGGILGTLAIPFLASLGPMAPGLGEVSVISQFGVQLMGVVVVAGYSALVTIVLLLGIRVFVPLRVGAEAEETGLDASSHGESAYHY